MWSGKIGTLTASPTAIAMKIAIWTLSGSKAERLATSIMSKLCAPVARYSAMIPPSIARLPASV